MIETDVLVIGSGFGGSVAAARLVDAGVRVTLIERGGWRDSLATRQSDLAQRGVQLKPFPQGRYLPTHLLRQVSVGAIHRSKLLHRDGLFDISLHPKMSVFCSSGVGGGSHVYWAMHMRPQRTDYWSQQVASISTDTMEPHYAWIMSQMQSVCLNDTVPVIPNRIDHALAAYPALHTAVEQPALGFRFEGEYRHHSMLGDRHNHKISLDHALLLPRLQHGLQVYAEHECIQIRKVGIGYRVDAINHTTQQSVQFAAKTVILAAGTLNTLRLLYRSQHAGGLPRMPALGCGFSSNGDVFALWRAGQNTQNFLHAPPSIGRFQTQLDSPFLYAAGLNILQHVPLLPKKLQHALKDWLLLVGMGEDAANGTFSPQLMVEFDQQRSAIFQQIYQTLHGLHAHSKRRAWFIPQYPMTVHPLGGARLAAHPDQGVVDANGEVYGCPNLFIADGSALPAATGTPPSMSIAAWSGHVSQSLIQRL